MDDKAKSIKSTGIPSPASSHGDSTKFNVPVRDGGFFRHLTVVRDPYDILDTKKGDSPK